ncbi:MAG: NAD(P)H-dependent oxidoreductase [Methanobrevibacter sp.]|nr:NAD(P)H-dependent oxidoreductase [Methanobrevibacter sp.]
MKYLVINGSPREKNTWKIVKQAEKNIEGDFEEIHLMGVNIPLCTGCTRCVMEGEENCPHFDKVNPLVEKIKQCDGLIITSPVYAMNVSGLLKNFFDHTAYIFHRQDYFTKKALVIVSTAGAGQKKVANYIDESLRHWGFNKVYKIAYACGGKETLENEEIDKTAKKFSDDVKSKKLHPPKFGDVLFFNVWKAMALTKNPIPADKKFWLDTGLINHDFGPEVKLNPIKKAFSKLMFFILKRVIK